MEFNSNFQYRKYLIKNGENIIAENKKIAVANTSCAPDIHTKYKAHNNTPFLYSGLTANEKPLGYTESDLKNAYIQKQVAKYKIDNFKIINPLQYMVGVDNVKK